MGALALVVVAIAVAVCVVCVRENERVASRWGGAIARSLASASHACKQRACSIGRPLAQQGATSETTHMQYRAPPNRPCVARSPCDAGCPRLWARGSSPGWILARFCRVRSASDEAPSAGRAPPPSRPRPSRAPRAPERPSPSPRTPHPGLDRLRASDARLLAAPLDGLDPPRPAARPCGVACVARSSGAPAPPPPRPRVPAFPPRRAAPASPPPTTARARARLERALLQAQRRARRRERHAQRPHPHGDTQMMAR